MKKKIALLIVCMLTLGAGSAFAAAGSGAPSAGGNAASASASVYVKKAAVLKEFQDELHQIDALRVDRLGLKTEIVQKQDKLIDLTLAARESRNKEALKTAAGIRKQIHALDGEIKTLWSQMNDQRKQFREAVKAKDEHAAQTAIDGVIATFNQVNAKLTEKSGLYDQMIAALTPAV